MHCIPGKMSGKFALSNLIIRTYNLPRNHDPASSDSCDDHTTSNVDVLGKQVCHVIRAGDNVCTQICSNLSYAPGEANKESPCSASWSVPLAGECQGVPDILAIDDLSRRARYYSKDTKEKSNDWEEEALPPDTVSLFEISCKIRHIGCHGRPASADGRKA